MLEQLKKAEEGLNNFNNIPEEQRYYYDPDDKFVIHVTKLDQIRLEDTTVCYKFKGYEYRNKNRWWFNFFYDSFEFVTKEEAIERAKKDKARQKREIKEIENEISHLQNKLTDLKEEIENVTDSDSKL